MKHQFRYLVADVTPGATLTLSPDDSHHLTRVVRRGVGDVIQVIDDVGNLWDATISALGDEVAVIVGDTPRRPPHRPALHLAIGLADWGRLDLVVEKATEIGVRSVTIFRSERAGRVPDASAFAKRRERMNRVAEAAMRQSGHATAPQIGGIAALEALLAGDASPEHPAVQVSPLAPGLHADPSDPASATLVVVDPRGDALLGDVLTALGDGPVTLLIGPDAGLSETEVQAARDAGHPIARLGEGILRAETAAIVASAIAADHLRWGIPDAASSGE